MKIPSFLTSMGLAAFALLGLPGASAQEIVSTNEIACSKGGAEACFYAGADYAQGSNGLPVSMPKAAELFTKACTLGVPDGCFYTAGMYRRGADGIAVDPAKGIDLYETACTMGHEEACSATFAILRTAEKDEQDMPRLLSAFEKGCANQSMKACQWGAEIFYDGREGKDPGHIDPVRGAPLAEQACDVTAEPYFCVIGEIMYAKPDSPAFNAEKALKMTAINCEAGVKESCANLGGIYHSIGDYERAYTQYDKACQLGNEVGCGAAKDLKSWLDEWAEWNAKQAAREAEMSAMLNAGDYNGAVATAVSVYKSSDWAAKAVNAASAAGRMGDVDDYDLKVLELWFDSKGPGGVVKAEMRRRGIAVSGEYDSWAADMQTIRSANQRFNAARANTSSYRPIERGPSLDSKPMLSAADAAAQTREKYRYAHCTMNGNANRTVCQ
ncbi:MAG: sel1 repeat family protein [Alphaproteobacteria bacterium]|nr:sel1 repeat family protein [Alphaproteobacteria bacterium]|tara:strand:- start:960 stop:2282 length:1323 start_codon:yes stop_codon:yes gene_type:complete